ncbi:MAG: hypothetical protein ACT4OJ_06250 [Bacteroidota bacterium]
MKKLLFLLALTASLVSSGQTVNGDVINARKNWFMRGYRIDTVTNDTANLDGKVKTLMTANAIHDFVVGRLAGVGGGSSGITVGTTTITGGTPGRIGYNNAGVYGEYIITGSGAVVMSTSPTIGTSIITTNPSFDVFNTTASTVNAFGAAGVLNIGGTPTIGLTHNYSANATATGNTKTVNIATGGASGSTTAINIGSATSGATNNVRLNVSPASDATGDIFYRNSSGYITRLGIGTNGHVLTVSFGLPAWAAPSGGGSGTVNSGTQYRLAYYATTGTAVSEAAAITANRALISDMNGVPTHATTTATEVGYVNGVTSSIQTQLNGKATISGTPADNQVGVWTSATAMEGTGALTFDGNELVVTTNNSLTTINGLKINNSYSGNAIASLVFQLNGSTVGTFFGSNVANSSYGLSDGLTFRNDNGKDIGFSTGTLGSMNGSNLLVKASGDVLVPNSNLGIGTATPSEKLHVNGNIIAAAPAYSTGGYQFLVRNSTSGRQETVSTVITEGSYTPTLSNSTNISASTAYTLKWVRVGDTYTVYGEVDIDPTSASTLSVLTISLPISSAFANTYDLSGTASDDLGTVARIRAETTADVAELRMTPSDVTNRRFSIHFKFKYTAP